MESPATAATAVSSESSSFAYVVTFQGISGTAADLMRSVSELVTRQKTPPRTLRALSRRVEADTALFQRVVRSEGYYDAEVRIEVDRDATPIAIAVIVESGKRYTLARVAIEGLPDDLAALGTSDGLRGMGIELGQPATGARVVQVGENLLVAMARHGYPFARITERRNVVDHRERVMRVHFGVDAGGRARIGRIDVEGLVKIKRKHVLRRIEFAPGDVYDPRAIERSRLALRDTRLFGSVRIAHGSALDDEGRLPVTIAVSEASLRSFGAGGGYSSSDGAGVQTSWEHRSLLGGGEGMRVTARYAQSAARLGAAYREPDFLTPNMSLLLDVGIEDVDTDAYDKRGGGVTVALERALTPRLLGTWGFSFEQARISEDRNVLTATGDVEQTRETDDFTLVGLPLTVRYDSSDDLLNPTQGLRASLSVVPYASWLGSAPGFVVMRFQQGAYLPLLDRGRLTLAGRYTVGTLFGEQRLEVPADKRFYAGGAGSVRGYAFQHAEDLVRGEDPDGGRSLFQMSAELRWRVWGNIGVVPFVDAAQIDHGETPLADDLKWGAGLGLRYYSPVGPVRMDIATPIHRRSGIDHAVEFYLSFGQAF